MQGFFRPEMLNRLDEIVVFRQLMRPQVSTACELFKLLCGQAHPAWTTLTAQRNPDLITTCTCCSTIAAHVDGC